MRQRKWRFGRRSGFLLAEYLIVILLFSFAIAAAMPYFRDWREEQQLNQAAAELAAAIRETEILAKSGDDNASTGYVAFTLGTNAKGQVEYYASRSSIRVAPMGTFPPNITEGKNLSLLFRDDGFAGMGEDYTTSLSTTDGKHVVEIIVAAYTGRVRVNKIK